MENRENAKMTRNGNIHSFLNTNSGVFATNTPMVTLASKTNTDIGACILAASAAGADNTGYSEEKVALKNTMGQLAAQYSGYAQVKFELIHKHSLAGLLNDSESFFTHASDAEAGTRALAALTVLTENKDDLTDYVSDDDLTALGDSITAFMTAGGTSGSVHEVSPALTQAFKSALKTTDNDIKNILKLGKFYKTSNSTFYNGLVEVCKTPTVNVHHTNVDGTVIDKETGLPAGNATAQLSTTTKTCITNAAGFFHIDHVHSGTATLTVKCTGYADFIMLISIQSGHDNSFLIKLEKI